MDSEILYALLGILVLILVIVFILKGGSKSQVQTKEEKKAQIIFEYKKQLKKALEPLQNNKEAMMAKKSELLKRFSKELAMNVFFHNNEIREIIQDLSRE